eukprot:m.85177 g.85177  ORF g.85177 m.85177 type:complete len:58 (+) comp9622_c0_seq1:3448-3621(+)
MEKKGQMIRKCDAKDNDKYDYVHADLSIAKRGRWFCARSSAASVNTLTLLGTHSSLP